MTFANNWDPDEAPQNEGPLIGFKLFDTKFINSKFWMENDETLQILQEKYINTIIMHMQRIKWLMIGW